MGVVPLILNTLPLRVTLIANPKLTNRALTAPQPNKSPKAPPLCLNVNPDIHNITIRHKPRLHGERI